MEQPQQPVRLVRRFASLNRVVLNLVELFKPVFDRKRLATGLDLDPKLPPMWIDAPQLEHSMAGLLRRLVKETRVGDLVLFRTATQQAWIRVYIGESRESPATASRAVPPATPGGAADTSASDQPSGLELSRAVIAAHGGEVMWDAPGRSASFAVQLPALSRETEQVLHAENVQLLHSMRRVGAGSHELAPLSSALRSPVSLIIEYTELLTDGVFGDLLGEQIDTIQRIGRCGEEVLTVVATLIDAPHGRMASGAAGLARDDAKLVTVDQGREQVELARTASHKLRVPLNAIIGYNDLLRDGSFGGLTPEQLRVLQSVRRSALDVLDVIEAELQLAPPASRRAPAR